MNNVELKLSQLINKNDIIESFIFPFAPYRISNQFIKKNETLKPDWYGFSVVINDDNNSAWTELL